MRIRVLTQHFARMITPTELLYHMTGILYKNNINRKRRLLINKMHLTQHLQVVNVLHNIIWT